MDDLRSQLEAQFGPASAEAEPEPEKAVEQWREHRQTAWWQGVVACESHGVRINPDASYATAVQQTDQVCKALKRAGRGGEAARLKKLRSEYQKLRDKKAWGVCKGLFSELSLPDKAYRSLKQGGTDPVKIIDAIRGKEPEDWKGMGARAVVEALGS